MYIPGRKNRPRSAASSVFHDPAPTCSACGAFERCAPLFNIQDNTAFLLIVVSSGEAVGALHQVLCVVAQVTSKTQVLGSSQVSSSSASLVKYAQEKASSHPMINHAVLKRISRGDAATEG
jgi:hypothetical protein